MKNIVMISMLLVLMASACKKDEPEYKAGAVVRVVNVVVGNVPIKVNPGAASNFSWAGASEVGYGASANAQGFAGSNMIKVVKSADTTQTIFNRTINLPGISTLYLAGELPNVDTIFREEKNFPFIDGTKLNPDYSMYIRFVNLSPNSAPLNINVVGSPTNEVTGLAYKGITLFKKYAAAPATSTLPATSDYVFEIKDAATNTLITTAKVVTSSTRYKTTSIIIRGLEPPIPLPVPLPSNPYPFGTVQVNYN